MGRFNFEYLDGVVWRCNQCKCHFAPDSEIFSKSFTGRNGRAFLFNYAVNFGNGKTEERELRTGKHVVTDIHCKGCYRNIGWKYNEAFEESEQYKIGKVVIEKFFMERINCDEQQHEHLGETE